MTHTFKLSRRTARLRALAFGSLLVLGAACDQSQPLEPVSETPVDAAQPSFLTSASAPGVAFGDFHLPLGEFTNSRYSGSLQALWATSGVYETLNSAKNNGRRVVISLAGSRSYYTNSDRTFNLTKWKQRIDAFRKYNFAQYVTSGTVLGHYLVDEPFCASCWGGKTISASTLEEMARYSKSIWSTLPTIVRSPPSLLAAQTYRYLDVAWAQWEGPLHAPSYKMTPEQFRDKETAAAQSRGLGLIFGLNYLDGGDGTSHINGTYAFDPKLSDNVYCSSSGSCYRYQMSAAEVKRVGSALAGAWYGCAVLSWQYNSTFVNRTGMKSALDAVSSVARNRSRAPCVR